MKKSHLVALLLVAVGVAIVVSTFEGASRYVTFAVASKLRQTPGVASAVHVIGKFPQDEQGRVYGIQTATDHRSFHFLLVDGAGEVQQVRYAHPIPPDFRRAEQVVIVGRAEENYFHADKILLKCPSKYEAYSSITDN